MARCSNMLAVTMLASQWSQIARHLNVLNVQRFYLRGHVRGPLPGLKGEVVDVGTAGVLPAMLVIHAGQVPRPWEQLLHGALGNVARCTGPQAKNSRYFTRLLKQFRILPLG